MAYRSFNWRPVGPSGGWREQQNQFCAEKGGTFVSTDFGAGTTICDIPIPKTWVDFNWRPVGPSGGWREQWDEFCASQGGSFVSMNWYDDPPTVTCDIPGLQEADIYLDGVFVQKTVNKTVTLTGLRYGDHTITTRATGFQDAVQTFNVPETRNITLTMRRL